MNEKTSNKNPRRPKKISSLEEKRNYCIAWKKSGMSQIDFCNLNGISKSSFYQWNKRFKTEFKIDTHAGFSPLVLGEKSLPKQMDIIQLTIYFSNQIQLSLGLPEHSLVSLIQELGYATATVR